MRDLNRIDKLLLLINKLWLRNPDLRFNQLIYNLQHRYSKLNDNKGRIECVEADGFTQVGFDLFNVEDDDFIEFLEREIQESEK